jgi:hypothetical protein
MSFFTFSRFTIPITSHLATFDKFRLTVTAFNDKRNLPQCIEHHGNRMQHSMKNFVLIAVVGNCVVGNLIFYRIKIPESQIIKGELIEHTHVAIIDNLYEVLFPLTDEEVSKRILGGDELD